MNPSKLVSYALISALLAAPASAIGESAFSAPRAYDPLIFATAIPPEAFDSPDCAWPTAAPAQTPGMTAAPTRLVTATPQPTSPVSSTPQPTATVFNPSTPRPTATAAVTAMPTAMVTPSVTDGHYTIGSPSAQEQEAYNYLTEDRNKNGRSTLTLDPTLCYLARMKSQDMLTNGYFAHTSPTLGSASDMLRQYGYAFSAVGENIAHHASVAKSHAAFLSSEGHRRNMMSTSWTKVGIGVVTDQNGYVYVTQLFVR